MADKPCDIRVASADDAPRVQAMLEALAAETGTPGAFKGTVADLLEYGFGKQPRFTAFLATTGEVDVGLLLCFPEYSSWRGRPGIYVQDLFVANTHRGGGIARALLAEAAKDIAYLRLSAAASNAAGARFYERTGFREAADERIFVIEGSALDRLRTQD